jgi:hypothetical protein
MENETIHVFEKAGLGKAPFTLEGVDVRTYCAFQGAPVQPGAACGYCSTGIMECCLIRSSDGKHFIVGNECVKKTYDKGLVNAAKKAVNKIHLDAKHKREAERITAARKAFTESDKVQEILVKMPHPTSYGQSKGLTYADYASWMFNHAGVSGSMKVTKVIESIIKNNP